MSCLFTIPNLQPSTCLGENSFCLFVCLFIYLIFPRRDHFLIFMLPEHVPLLFYFLDIFIQSVISVEIMTPELFLKPVLVFLRLRTHSQLIKLLWTSLCFICLRSFTYSWGKREKEIDLIINLVFWQEKFSLPKSTAR